METARRWNWSLWAGFLLSIVALVSYPTIFIRWPVTRDFPWVNLLLFLVAMVLLVMGVVRAPRKTLATIVAVLGAGLFAFSLFGVLVLGKQVPASLGAPKVGQKASDFTLLDSNRRSVSLSQLLASSPRGALLIFYRGYW
jgi:hypothetical protein